jgi:hypothetical protein
VASLVGRLTVALDEIARHLATRQDPALEYLFAPAKVRHGVSSMWSSTAVSGVHGTHPPEAALTHRDGGAESHARLKGALEILSHRLNPLKSAREIQRHFGTILNRQVRKPGIAGTEET